MADDQDSLQRVIKAVKSLPAEKQRQLMEQLARELETQDSVTPLALSGIWAGIALSGEEIDEARRECWAGLGDER